MYGVSPHPAQAPENSISGCLNEKRHHRGGDGAHEDLGVGVFTAEP